MKKYIKMLSLLIFLLLLTGKISFSQPSNAHIGAMGMWGDAALADRGVTMSGNVQAPITTTIQFLFNTAVDVYTPKWCGSTTDYQRPLNQKISGGAFYYVSGGWDANLTCSVQLNYYYTLIVGKNATSNNDMSILETSYNPVDITTVSQSPAPDVAPMQDVTITVTLSGAKNANEKVFIRYTTDQWVTSNFIEIPSFNASFQGTAVIPGLAAGIQVSYYVLTSNQSTVESSSVDYYTLRLNNNSNSNYSYTVTYVPEITWCNLQWPAADTITTGSSYDVFAQVFAQGITDTIGQGAGIQAWIGYSTTNTNPDTWTNWIPASYTGDIGNNDEYKANIGSSLPAGIYYYASRFKLGSGSYCYGGYNSGYWNGTTNLSGVLTVNDITWCNLQWPASDTILAGGTYNVYARVYAPGLTDTVGQGAGIQAWIGYSDTNTNPNTWTNWVPATYYADEGNNDEYNANIGSTLPAGTYFYASRFQLGSGAYYYGGFNSGFWDGTTNVSGSLKVNSGVISWCNVQWPAADTITVGGSIDVYARVYAEGITDAAGQGTGIQAWIGYSTSNTNPDTWTNWLPANFYADAGNNDEYKANIGAALPSGLYYYASRFKLNSGAYFYGGYNAGLWDGTTNKSGVLTVNEITWCNIQWPSADTIVEGAAFNVYAQVYAPGITDTIGQGAGIQAWIGYSSLNTHPGTWINWIPATFNLDAGNNDEYIANIGTSLPAGVIYYASRFQLNGGTYFYGGYNSGFWNGITSVSGIVTVNHLTINWCNVQWPEADTIAAGSTYDVYSRVYAPGVTDVAGQGAGIQAWIGYNTANTNPNTWTNWVAATYNADDGNNDEYKANIGSTLPAGVYYYASRFKLGNGSYYYGGYNAGFWNGTTNVSGILTVTGTGYTISGKTRYTGKAINGSPAPNPATYNSVIYNIDNVIVILKNNPGGTEVARDTSDVSGVYQFTGVANGSYILSYDKYTLDTMQWGNDVNAIDLALIKYYIGSDTLNDPSRNFYPKYRKAANVDNNASINAIDISRIKAKVGSPYNVSKNFPKGNWVALDTSVTVNGANLTIDLKTICYGDYNASSTKYRDSVVNWNMTKSYPENIITVADEYISTTNPAYFEIPLRISDAINDFSAMSLELTYPDNDFELVGAYLPNKSEKGNMEKINPTLEEIIAKDNDLLVTDEQGVIRVVYATTNHFDVEAGEQVIVLAFRSVHMQRPGELQFEMYGTGVMADQYGTEGQDVYLLMPKVLVQSADIESGMEISGYPNPFNGETSLSYSLPESGKVVLNVYNAIGELVTTLVNESQLQGAHKVEFSGKDWPEGMYTFKLGFESSQRSEHAVLKMIR
ncbi:MAG TPA: hypothetical protein PKW80_10175 [Bacteroidales bacterium]|nr:hypothetical protein [Bacteroidales bacterium]